MSTNDSLPDDVETLKAMLIAAQAACLEAQAKARNLEADDSPGRRFNLARILNPECTSCPTRDTSGNASIQFHHIYRR